MLVLPFVGDKLRHEMASMCEIEAQRGLEMEETRKKMPC